MTKPPPRSPITGLVAATTPGLFVLLWSTGFIGAKYGLPYAEPFTFLLIRMSLVTVLLGGCALVTGAPWPTSRLAIARTAIAGILVHGVYLGGIFGAIYHGLPAGTAALIAGLQPLLTAALAGPLLGERLHSRQWLGLGLGLAGMLLVMWVKLSWAAPPLGGLALAVAGLCGITGGTIYQKIYGGNMNLISGTAIQYAASAIFYAILAISLETMHVNWTGDFIFALAWLCLVLSVGAIFLLFILIRRGAASEIASLFYLVPPVTALIAYGVFGETLNMSAIAGMALVAIGVALVVRR